MGMLRQPNRDYYMPAVHRLLKKVGEKAGDLTVIIRHFAKSDDEIAPPWLISSRPANWRGGQARSRMIINERDMDL